MSGRADAAQAEQPAPDGSAAPAAPAVRLVTLAPGVRAAFTGRSGGVSRPPYDSLNMGAGSGDSAEAVARNRELAAAACGLTTDRMTWMRQVHSADVAFVTDPAHIVLQAAADPPRPRDASLTTVPGLALGVLSADCPAVLLADPEAGIVGAAHSGRTGTARGSSPRWCAP